MMKTTTTRLAALATRILMVVGTENAMRIVNVAINL